MKRLPTDAEIADRIEREPIPARLLADLGLAPVRLRRSLVREGDAVRSVELTPAMTLDYQDFAPVGHPSDA